MNILFVCEANMQRSPTFEDWFKKNKPEHEVNSAGTLPYSRVVLNEELLEWADIIYVMDLKQEMFIAREYLKYIDKCYVIGVSDEYSRNSQQLIRLIEYWVDTIVI